MSPTSSRICGRRFRHVASDAFSCGRHDDDRRSQTVRRDSEGRTTLYLTRWERCASQQRSAEHAFTLVLRRAPDVCGQARAVRVAYRRALTSLVSGGYNLTICTIYDGALEHDYARLARVALMTFNDVILRVAFELGVNVIDLRQVCVESADYANPIEPSGTGGRKIARAISCAVGAVPGAVVSRVSGG